MPIITKDADGNEIEAFTQEELEAQKAAALEEFKAQNPDRSEELAELQAKLAEASEKLAKADDKDKNFAALRKAKEEADGKLNEVLKGQDEKLNKFKNEIMESVLKDHYEDTIKSLVGDDAELRKVVELNYKRLADPTASKADISKKLQDAFVLANKREESGALNSSVLSSGNAGRLNIKSNNKGFSAEEEAIAKNFGLSDADLKKYGKN